MAKDRFGSGKGGGGSPTFREDENTLRSNVIASVIEGLGEGPIRGLVEGKKSVILNTTPLQQKDGTNNFTNNIIMPEPRLGDHVQTLPDGFETAGIAQDVTTDVTVKQPKAIRTTDPLMKAVEVTILLPEGLYEQKTDENAITKTKLEFVISIKPDDSSTLYTEMVRVKYDDKTTSPYQETFLIQKPATITTGFVWIEVKRITPDNASAVLHNQLKWAYYNELRPNNTTYPDVAFIALEIDANSVNTNTVPTRGFIVNGLVVDVPDNYNNKRKTFKNDAGADVAWSGGFTPDWTDDPAWVVYALARNSRWGLGFTADQIDAYSFMDASRYNSEIIPFKVDPLSAEQHSPRYLYNHCINTGETAIEKLNKVAAIMHSKVAMIGNQLTILQDRPTSVISHVFNRSSIVGHFKYIGTPRDARTTVCNVTWNDKDALFAPRVSSASATSAEILANGLNQTQIQMDGITNEPQAIRAARWVVDTSINTAETVIFTVGKEGLLVLTHQVIETYDDKYHNQAASGRLINGSSTTSLKLDRNVGLAGTSTVTLQYADGTVAQRSITSTGVTNTITITPALTTAPDKYTVFNVATNGITPRLWRVETVKENDDRQTFEITAHAYDPAKYARIEQNVVKQSSSNIISTTVLAPTNMVFFERVLWIDDKVVRNVSVTWDKSPSSVVNGYILSWKNNGGPVTTVNVPIPFFEIQNVLPGTLEVRVVALSAQGIQSRALIKQATIGGIPDSEAAETLHAPTNLRVVGVGGTLFTGSDLVVEFTNPPENSDVHNAVLKCFNVKVFTGTTLIHEEIVERVDPGAKQKFTYFYLQNLKDGGPRRTVTLEVRCVSASDATSLPATATFSNPPPGIPSNIVVSTGFGNNKVSYRLPTDLDFEGVLVWASTEAGFILSEKTLIREGTETYFVHTGLEPNTHYYYVFAAYDSFFKDYTGKTLNLSSVFQVVSVSTDFDTNKLQNSSFETCQLSLSEFSPPGITNAVGRPFYWIAMPGGPTSYNIVYTVQAGRNSNNAVGIKVDSIGASNVGNTANQLGIRSFTEEDGGAVGGYNLTKDYVISIFAVKQSGLLDATGIDVVFTDDYPPTIKEVLLNPVINATWQRWAWHVRWDYNVPSHGRVDFVVVRANGTPITAQVGDEVIFDDSQIEQGDRLTDYAPRVTDLAPGSIRETMILPGSVTTPLLVANSVVSSKIAGDQISAHHMQAGSITADKVDINDLSALSGNFGSPTKTFKVGNWDAATNTPTLVDRTGPVGGYYVVSVAGNTILGSRKNWVVGNCALFDGSAWRQFAAVPGDSIGGVYAGYVHGAIISGGDLGYDSGWPLNPNLYGFQFTNDGAIWGKRPVSKGGVAPDKFFQITTAGDVYSPNFSIENGNLSLTGAVHATSGTFTGRIEATDGFFSGDISGATGTFSGLVKIAEASVGTLEIKGHAVTLTQTSYTPGYSSTVYMSIPPEATGARKFKVPAGVTTINITSVGGGGGGGGSIGSGDSHPGGGGGCGGVAAGPVTVAPNDEFYVYVGVKGDEAAFIFNGQVFWPGNGTRTGGNGTASSVVKNDGLVIPIFVATGGYGGNGTADDNPAPADATHSNGSGNNGTPNAAAHAPGEPPPPNPYTGEDSNRNQYAAISGATNGTGYGGGGQGNSSVPGQPVGGPTPGQDGAVVITYTDGTGGHSVVYNPAPTVTANITVTGNQYCPGGVLSTLLARRPSEAGDGSGPFTKVRQESVAGGTTSTLFYNVTIDEAGTWAFQMTDQNGGAVRTFCSALLTLR